MSNLKIALTMLPLVLAITLVSSGCIGPSGFTNIASIEGRWSGTVVAISAVDSRGNTVPAAALRLTNGPTWVLEADLGGGREPLLVQGPPQEYRLVDPGTLPVGRRVEVEGKTIVLHANAGSTDLNYVTRTRRHDPDSTHEHLLVVRKLVEVK